MKNEPVGTILTGGFPPLFPIMNPQTVESMVTHLVQCSCSGFIHYPKEIEKVLVEAKDLPFKQSAHHDEDQGKTPMIWNSILQDLLLSCPQFCRDELLLPKPANTTRWRERSSREVLAPLGLKHNTENIIAGSLDMSRKRKADTSIWTPTKRVKVDDTLKPCSVVIKRASLNVLLMQHKYTNNIPFVRLHDIIKEIPQVKEEVTPITQHEFMGFLGLNSQDTFVNKNYPKLKASHPIKLLSHPLIPFSSDYGRRLLMRERHCVPQEVALRKIERTERYMIGAAAVVRNNQEPEVTYDRRIFPYTHTYNFPKRQYHQIHPSLQQAFNKYLCKPLCIHLEIKDLDNSLEKMKNKVQEVVSTAVMINKTKGEDGTLTSKTVLPETKKTVLTINCATLNNDYNCDVKSNVLQCSVKVAKPTLISKPRRSLRLNYTKSRL